MPKIKNNLKIQINKEINKANYLIIKKEEKLNKYKFFTKLLAVKFGILKQYKVAAEKALRFYMHPENAFANLQPQEQVKLIENITELYEGAVQVRKSFGVSEVLAMAKLVRPYGMTISPIFYKTMMSMAAGDMLMKSLTPDPLDFILAQMALKLIS